MRHQVPAELSALLSAEDGRSRDDAWNSFVERYTPLLLHASRSHGGDRDAVMDRYAFILERLKADNFRRLRSWERDRRSKLTTWLTVVAQHASLDLYRERYGRPRSSASSGDERAARRRLVDLLAEEIDERRDLHSNPGDDAESHLREVELSERLHDAVAGLDSSDQLLLSLRFHDGLSAAAIARALEFPTPFHVYRRLDHLFARLRTALLERGVEDARP